MSRPPDLPPGVGYAPASAANGTNGHDPLAHQAHYAALTEVTLPISGLVVTVRPVDGMDLYRLGLPPSFFSRSVQATQELQAPVSVAEQAGAATTNMELLVQAGDRFAAFAILRPKPVATPELVTGPDTFCPDLLPTSDKVWLIQHFVLNGEAQAAVSALFRSEPAGQSGPRLAPAPVGPDLSPSAKHVVGPASGQRRRTGS